MERPTIEISTCSICLDDFFKIKRLTKILDCGHKYCRRCLSIYCRNKAQEHSVDFSCPECKEPFNPEGLIGKQWLIKWEKRKKALGRIMCPRLGCSGEILGQTCLKCRHLICRLCLEEIHTGPCQEEIVQNIEYKINLTKQCPQCGVNIEKNGGCNHMKCRSCGHDFKWEEVKKNNPRFQIPQRPKLDELSEPIKCIKCRKFCQTINPLCCFCLRREIDVEYELCQCCRS